MLAVPDFVYGKARVAFGMKLINWLTDPINALYVNAGYAPNNLADQYVSDIPAGAIVARDYALTSLAMSTNGVCSGTVPQLNAFTDSNVPIIGIVLYVKTGNDATSRLVYFSSSGIGFPFTPAGFNYVVGYDQANGGFFQI